jgi:hypothetical protein
MLFDQVEKLGPQDDRIQSRLSETKTYTSALRQMYVDAFDSNALIYDIAHKLTDGFTNITSASVMADSRVIKVLRYAVAPTISQMKFGQFVGLNSVDKFEKKPLKNGTSFENLRQVAENITIYVNKNIDKDRFIWIDDPAQRTPLSESYAKKWTCSIAADQNAQTSYRNWRKDKQEKSAHNAIEGLGYSLAVFKGILQNPDDLQVGTYTYEIKVKGRTTQKADIVCRSKKTNKLVLIEAKAVGVELDATKRVKECCDKANDWRSSDDLMQPQVVSLIAGFFTENNIRNLEASNIKVVWEHKLEDFGDIL